MILSCQFHEDIDQLVADVGVRLQVAFVVPYDTADILFSLVRGEGEIIND